MELMNMDQMLEEKPELCLEGKVLALCKIGNASIGQKFQISCMGTVKEISTEKGEDGLPRNEVCFELDNIECVPQDQNNDVSHMYPSMTNAMP